MIIVDDDRTALRAMDRLIKQMGYRALCFGDPAQALEELAAIRPKVLVTDHDMPGMTGLDLAERALESDPSLRVVLVTGAGDEVIAQSALRLGVADYLKKPFESRDLARVVRVAFLDHARNEYEVEMDEWLRDEVRRQTRVIRRVTLGTLASLINAVEARTPHFEDHSQNVAGCAMGIARAVDLPADAVQSIRIAGLLHDVGMIAVPDAVVNKPGDLNREEYHSVVGHCRQGATILAPMEHLGPVPRFVLEHHERWDGSGYPDRKAGDESSLGGQIVGLAEVWSALTEVRPFRDRMSRADAMATLVGSAGRWFQPELIEALRRSQEAESSAKSD